MSEYNIIDLHDKEKCLLEYLSDRKHYLIECQNSKEAHEIKLSLMLGTMASPLEAPELYESQDRSGKKIFIPLPIAFSNDDEDGLDQCCQSGCQGCPHFKGRINE